MKAVHSNSSTIHTLLQKWTMMYCCMNSGV